MKIAIRGHESRGKEVIQILESLGGISRMNYSGRYARYFYYISSDDSTIAWTCIRPEHFKVYTLEEFEKEFPFKIGDKVLIKGAILPREIIRLEYYCNQLCYKLSNGLHYEVYDLEPYKEIEEMEERNVTLTLTKAKEWYKKGGELKEVALQAYSEEELTKKEFPKTWKEFCENYPVRKGECWLGGQDNILNGAVPDDGIYRRYKNWIPSKKSAEAHLAMIQLEQLRNCWWNGWEPIWDISHKWSIRLYGNGLSIGITTNMSRFLTFPTKEMAEEFLKCFGDLIKKAGDLI